MKSIERGEGSSGMVKPNSFAVICGWMITELGLSGNDLLIYAVIYGYSTAGRDFVGGLRYLCEWTRSTKKTVLKALQNLQDADLIERVEAVSDRGRAVYWRCKNYTMGGVEITPGWCKNYTMGGVEITPPTNNVNKYNIYNNIYNAHAREVQQIVTHLNSVTGSAWNADEFMPATRILELLEEGYTADDLIAVIDHKASEWAGNFKMHRFLRPSTLFGDKFTRYLSEARAGPQVQPSASGSFGTDEFFEAALANTLKQHEEEVQ